ncbi:MAG TPA: BON domain-containing protein [Caldimonas sp.]|nr:BON domain-containing protein [Caldimonas sp.]
MPGATRIARIARLASTLVVGAGLAAAARSADDLRNWFDDPFFQISSSVPDCPVPAGPFVGEADKRVQAHRRAEKGTTCWLAGECERPNAYAYDADIAAAFRKAVAGPDRLPGTTLWVTVQGRVVYIEGCALRESSVAAVEALARSLPHVQQAIAIVRTDPAARPPYKLRSP